MQSLQFFIILAAMYHPPQVGIHYQQIALPFPRPAGSKLAYPGGHTGALAACESCLVTVRFPGFHRIWQGSGKVFDTVDLFLPDQQYETQVS